MSATGSFLILLLGRAKVRIFQIQHIAALHVCFQGTYQYAGQWTCQLRTTRRNDHRPTKREIKKEGKYIHDLCQTPSKSGFLLTTTEGADNSERIIMNLIINHQRFVMEDKNVYTFDKLSFVFCISPIFQVFWDSNTVNCTCKEFKTLAACPLWHKGPNYSHYPLNTNNVTKLSLLTFDTTQPLQ